MIINHRSAWLRSLALSVVAALLCINAASFAPAAHAAQKDKKEKKGKKAKGSGPTEAGKPMIWQDRGDVSKLDLIHGIGGPDRMPKPPFTFVKEDVSGTNPKVRVTDANGATWNVKFDEEVHAEVAASRIVYAAGYMVEESYFIASGKIDGVSGLGRAKKFVRPDGSFSAGMFERRPEDVTRRAIPWEWTSNPFRGTKELSGLIILLAMLNNWDAKTTNNNVLGMYAGDQSTVHDWYIVADWGGTFGKMGGFLSHSKWDLKAYSSQAFIDGVSGNTLKLNYSGKLGSGLAAVPLDHAKWFAGIIGQLTDQQLRDAFKAAGATEQEVSGFSSRLRTKINELKRSVGM
jgi:hypothetical protein